MAYRKKGFILALMLLLASVLQVQAEDYEVLYANSKNIRIGKNVAVKGLRFSDTDQIEWSSDTQALRVLNLTTKRIQVLPAKTFIKKGGRSLADMLHRTKHLSTRDYGTNWAVADTVAYLLDTLCIDAGRQWGLDVKDEVVVVISGERIVTTLQRTTGGREFVITRAIFGHRPPQTVYVDIVETDSQRGWQYFVYRRLRIEPLPLS